MILGLGTDIVEISRMAEALERPRFLERFFTPQETSYLTAGRPERVAGVFAAKEAVSKALGTGFLRFGPDSVEIVHDDLGRPICRLYGEALLRFERMGGRNILISISHERHYAVAACVIEGEAEQNREGRA